MYEGCPKSFQPDPPWSGNGSFQLARHIHTLPLCSSTYRSRLFIPGMVFLFPGIGKMSFPGMQRWMQLQWRKTVAVAMTLKDNPLHAVRRLSVAGSEFSSRLSIRNFFIGPGRRVVAEARTPVNVDGSASSSVACRFSTFMLWIRFRCSCSPFVEPPVTFRIVEHSLHLSELPPFSRKKGSYTPSFLKSTNSAISIAM